MRVCSLALTRQYFKGSTCDLHLLITDLHIYIYAMGNFTLATKLVLLLLISILLFKTIPKGFTWHQNDLDEQWFSQSDLVLFQKETEREFRMRRRRLELACKAIRSGEVSSPPINYKQVLIYPENNVYWCPVFKVSTTTWLRFMFKTTRSLTEASSQFSIDIITSTCIKL